MDRRLRRLFVEFSSNLTKATHPSAVKRRPTVAALLIAEPLYVLDGTEWHERNEAVKVHSAAAAAARTVDMFVDAVDRERRLEKVAARAEGRSANRA